ncbi:tRNA lysidine(34) synthetase TilS [Allosphingosinicella indica]|uniref:tRNA(Ile)-lysidine synthase n=1 Tax=Allosphingosinicella indica TaxID=941907 RepID=A0A1X7GSP7_9SPHN|nr:tRNA lysidine(34) synthetase TilS [Allosphingosinicella indica]SMF74180.1 tRNA(Ile)-lysidine synthase [Allosphingosinicella indica]
MLTPTDRFAADLVALWAGQGTLGIAVSGGPDSLALLLLAASAVPGRMAAATIDHGLRTDAAAEAAMVGAVCCERGIPHEILVPGWDQPPAANIQAAARVARYAALAEWAARNGIEAVATAHHADDQAETLLMRLARGSGLAGLAGVRAATCLPGSYIALIRPLLGWRKMELEAVVAAAGLTPAHDPTNNDFRFDRTRARSLLADTDWIEPPRLAASAAHLAEAEEALCWASQNAWDERAEAHSDRVTIDAKGLPRDLQRRLLLRCFAHLGATPPRGPELGRVLNGLVSGSLATLGGLQFLPGDRWTVRRAPPRN